MPHQSRKKKNHIFAQVYSRIMFQLLIKDYPINQQSIDRETCIQFDFLL